ncbi:MAG: ribbon-helix-helix domain-containing protein [Egibacteraceae bacterium]
MTVQVNVRFDEDTVDALDAIAAEEGRTRAEIVRDAVHHRLEAAASARVGAAYQRAYEEQPETDDELQRAERSAQRLTSEEPWEQWW